MKRFKKLKWLICITPILSLSIAACVGGSEVGLTDVNWSLTSLNGQDLVPGTYINAEFDEFTSKLGASL